jgi:hypothetical protein
MNIDEAKNLIIPFDYRNINTKPIEGITNEVLLSVISGNAEIAKVAGYGLIAELCKRFELLTKENNGTLLN